MLVVWYIPLTVWTLLQQLPVSKELRGCRIISEYLLNDEWFVYVKDIFLHPTFTKKAGYVLFDICAGESVVCFSDPSSNPG